ncbi:methylated-DNA/protein-cysteinemethyltransferase [Thermodesulfatator indicus DSM 15286]|uniref:methylated-DNA--[protein]-cysteine S-methyltransferase n=1 Tax=Thermodesulfatator indicus (strain DSM 15286 / JCM 11887 / CIR29812) TaxID=667014 RepID=F8A9C2_THEID|nr:methylated-DNA--[protein]-cysteine S-methyltransferase [Thermodesulfatator indicus]AEH44063.1 methylated-DNA/protein-cysteinemethyltransferase [Thermodesulfatator indicus DSM 15286]
MSLRYKATFRVKDFLFTALWDEDGRLWHLTFGARPAGAFLNRLPKGYSFTEAPISFKKSLEKELLAYFSGQTKTPVYPTFLSGSSFEKRVWLALLEIPFGEIRTYAWLAQKIGFPKALRAVGRALSKNPLPILYPCHRIVAKSGLGGFSSGLEIKKKLLAIEGIHVNSLTF